MTASQPLTAIELFAGIGGFRLALDQLSIPTLWANDNKAKACAVYQDQFGTENFHNGDIRQLYSEIPAHNLLTAGFPCQPFSSAGKKKGIRDPRGTLFQTIAQILDQHQPTYFVLENVKRLLTMEKGAHFATILSHLTNLGYTVEWRLLNATHFGLPQNRQRIFIIGSKASNIITNIRLATNQDLNPHLEKDYFTLQNGHHNWQPLENHLQKFTNWGIAQQGRYWGKNLSEFSESNPTPSIQTILQNEVATTFDYTESTLERLKNSEYVNRMVEGVHILYNQKGGARMGYTVFGTEGVAPTLTATTSRHYERYHINSKFRRLTNIEYARIQGFPDNHCQAVSVYDQYGLFGNAVPPAMAKWVISRLINPPIPIIQPNYAQMSLF